MRRRIFPTVMIMLAVIFGAIAVVAAWKYFSRSARADERPKASVVWSNVTNEVIKIQDGECVIYFGRAWGAANGIAIATGPGCK